MNIFEMSIIASAIIILFGCIFNRYIDKNGKITMGKNGRKLLMELRRNTDGMEKD